MAADGDSAGGRSWSFPIGCAAVLAILAVAGFLLASGGGSGGDARDQPLPGELPSGAVAEVTHVPSELGIVSKADLDRAMIQQSAQRGLQGVPPSGGKQYGKLREAAITELLDAIWLRGQAREMGIAVTPARVAEEEATIKKQDFKTTAAYENFLRSSHFTEDDIARRVELQLLSTEIQEQIAPGSVSTGGKRNQSVEEAFSEFVTAFQRRWRSRTVCAPGYVTDECSNGPSP